MVSLHETFTDHKVQVLINNSRILCTRSRSLGVSRMINVDLNFSKEISFAESWNSWDIYFSQHRTLRTSAEFGSSRTGENDVACFFFGILFYLSGQRRVRLPAVIITVSPGSRLSVSITSIRCDGFHAFPTRKCLQLLPVPIVLLLDLPRTAHRHP